MPKAIEKIDINTVPELTVTLVKDYLELRESTPARFRAGRLKLMESLEGSFLKELYFGNNIASTMNLLKTEYFQTAFNAVRDYAMNGSTNLLNRNKDNPLGGIDFNSANLNLQIKRDGKDVPLPLAQQDMAQLNNIQGFVPVILEIKSAVSLPIFSELLLQK